MSLRISDLHVQVIDQATDSRIQILKGVSLEVKPGELHAIMGPNGSGKSTLAYTLAGHPFYEMTQGKIELDGQNVSEMSPDQRANAGVFLAFQYPIEVPGVKLNNFLRKAHGERFQNEPEKQFAKVLEFRKHVEELADTLQVNRELLKRGLNEGFSGGEKKRVEILQMAVLEPKYAILDETDSGLDVDAIKAVAKGIQHICKTYGTGMIIITHYQRILKYLTPDVVHVMKAGKIVQTGGADLAQHLEQHGFLDVKEA
jgi:Fe-S cluster assembly ATP-binding protein